MIEQNQFEQNYGIFKKNFWKIWSFKIDFIKKFWVPNIILLKKFLYYREFDQNCSKNGQKLHEKFQKMAQICKIKYSLFESVLCETCLYRMILKVCGKNRVMIGDIK